MKTISLYGQTFNRLRVITRASNNKRGQAMWHCQCECGAVLNVESYHLRSGHTQSCGCYQKDQAAKVGRITGKVQGKVIGLKYGRTNGLKNKIHGEAKKTTEYSSWQSMINRCHNPNNKNYGSYGDIGVVVCPSWRYSYETFLRDMGRKPSKDHSLDRINPFGNYEPCNCRWADWETQYKNTRRSKRI